MLLPNDTQSPRPLIISTELSISEALLITAISQRDSFYGELFEATQAFLRLEECGCEGRTDWLLDLFAFQESLLP